jgi:hypothetical protein
MGRGVAYCRALRAMEWDCCKNTDCQNMGSIGSREGEGAIGRMQVIGGTAQAIEAAEARVRISPGFAWPGAMLRSTLVPCDGGGKGRRG